MSGETEKDVSGWTTDTLDEKLRELLKGVRDYTDGQVDVLKERLDAMDKAANLLSETVNRAPTEMQKQIGHLRELSEERFKSVDTQFTNVKEATQLALSTQKESLAKTEENTKESQVKLENLLSTKTDALSASLGEVKTSIERINNLKLGGEQNIVRIYAAIAAAVGVIGLIILLANKVF